MHENFAKILKLDFHIYLFATRLQTMRISMIYIGATISILSDDMMHETFAISFSQRHY